MAFNVCVASYTSEVYYKIPADWQLDDISIKWGQLFYQGELKKVPKCEFETDHKRPDEIIISNDEFLDYFDCEEPEEEPDE